jgi:hypothetical protein
MATRLSPQAPDSPVWQCGGRVLVGSVDKGAGVAVGPQRVLTARHVVGGRQPGTPVSFQPLAGDAVSVCLPIRFAEGLDAAALDLADAVVWSPVANAKAGERWFANATGASNDPVLTGAVSAIGVPITDARGNRVKVIQLQVEQDLGGFKGYSGGAVLNEQGQVTGLLIEQKPQRIPVRQPAASNVLFALPIADVAKSLRIDVSLAPEQPEALAAQRTRLESYLTAARAAATQHPYTIGIVGAPSLSAVYLPQQLAVQVDQTPSSNAGGLAPGREPVGGTGPQPAGRPGQEPAGGLGRKLADNDQPVYRRGGYTDPKTGVTVGDIREALQRLDIDDVLERNQRALIVGAPGSGKSSLLRHLIEVSADDWAGEERHDFIPVLVHARSLLGSLPINKAIAGALRQDLGARLDDIDLDGLFASSPMPGLSWLILLDGLDEIFEPDSRHHVMDIVERWQGDPRYRFLITSRPLPDRELYTLRAIGMPTYEIQTIAEDQLPLLARRWFHALGVPDPEATVDLFIAQVRRARMAQLARNPLIATISCVVFASNPDRELPYSRADLYEAFVASFLEKIFADGHFLGSIKERVSRYGPQASAAVDTLVGELRSLIQDLAISRFIGSELSLRAEAEQLVARYRPSTVPLNSWNHLAAELLVQSGLISARAGDLIFNHETIIEYLAACTRTMPSRTARLGIRERWQLVTRAGSNESYALFVVALLRRRGIDLTDRPPAVLQLRKLLHARLVAALVHDGCELEPNVVAVATQCLSTIATMKTSGIPDVLRWGIWWQDDDCVMAAKALTLIDKNRGLDLLFTLAADPTVPSFSVFDVLAEIMVMEDLTEIDSARGLSVLYKFASAPSAVEVDQIEDSFNRMMIADLILDRALELGTELLKTLSRDSSMDLVDRLNCIERLVDMDRTSAIEALISIIVGTENGLSAVLGTYSYLYGLDKSAAVAALTCVATDRARGGQFRAAAAAMLYRDAMPEGLRAFRELSSDQNVFGFHRVYHFAEFADQDERASRLLKLSKDTTLLPEWRTFAAVELLECARDEGVDALRAIKLDVSVDRRTRRNLAMRIFAYERLATAPELLIKFWRPVTRFMNADKLICGEDAVPSLSRYLLPLERRMGVRRFHPAPLLAFLGYLLCCLFAAGVLSAVFPEGSVLRIIWTLFGLVLLSFAWNVAVWSVQYILVTDMRLMVVRGLITRKITIMPLISITDMYFERPIFGQLFGYGTFSFAGSGMLRVLKYVPYPERLYRDIFSLALSRESDSAHGK